MQADHIQILALPLPSKQGAYLPSLSLLGCEMAVAAILTSWGIVGTEEQSACHMRAAPSLKAPPVNCCCMLNSKLARPRRRPEAPPSGVPRSHWNTVKYPEQEREEGPRGGPGSWRVESCAESQGQPRTAGRPRGREDTGAARRPPSRLSSTRLRPHPHPCASCYETQRTLLPQRPLRARLRPRGELQGGKLTKCLSASEA